VVFLGVDSLYVGKYFLFLVYFSSEHVTCNPIYVCTKPCESWLVMALSYLERDKKLLRLGLMQQIDEAHLFSTMAVWIQ